MNSTLHPKRYFNLALAGLFVLAIWLPIVSSLSQFQNKGAINEYRMPAAFPELGDDMSIWQDYPKQLETYYDDHFGCRALLIACQLAMKRVLSPTEAGPVVLAGRDGWLYYLGDDRNMINHHLGLTRFTFRRMNDFKMIYEQRRDWLTTRGIRYLVVIVPDKDSVYPEQLPGWLNVHAATKTDQFIDFMRIHSTVDLLYLGHSIRMAGRYEPVFYKTDTHWNLLGAFAAYETIISRISKQIPGLKAVSRESFEIRREQGAGGDLARCEGELDLVDDNVYSLTPSARLPTLKFETTDTNQIDWSQFGSIPYPTNIFITTTNSQSTAQIVIFGDSFAATLEPFLAYNFGRVTFIKHKFDIDINFELINQSKPSLVIDEVVERSIR